MSYFTSKYKREYVDIARRRIVRVLGDRLYASKRQLESKINEAGPFSQRSQPIILSDAIQELLSEGVIKYENRKVSKTTTKFFYLIDYFDPANEDHKKRKNYVLTLYREYVDLSGNTKYCGDALEVMIEDAQLQADIMNNFIPIGSRKKQVLNFGDTVLPGALDFILSKNIDPHYMVAGEVKNIREWIYEGSHHVKTFLEKAVKLTELGNPVVPIFIARKISFSAFLHFKRLGILGFQNHRQYFTPAVEAQLKEIRHKDGLGFHDITTNTKPPNELIRFFKEILPARAVEVSNTFSNNIEVINEYLYGDMNFNELRDSI